jgi:alpha-L-fucosidase
MILVAALALLPAVVQKNPAAIPLASSESRAASAGWQKGGAWRDQHEEIKKIGLNHQVDLVLLGDSITQSWGGPGRTVYQAAAQRVWDKHLGHRNAANFGISGDSTQHILWRIDNGAFDNVQPKVISLMIGVNNTPRHTGEQIAGGIEAIVQRINTKLPNTKILLQSPIPAGQAEDHAYRKKLDKATEIIKGLHDGSRVHFLDIREAFITPDGQARTELMARDFIHLTPAGYQAWAEALEDKLAELMERDLVEQAVATLPSDRQMTWQDLEFTCFIHFGVNTFTGREWGTGKEDPKIFNPVDFDADQWVLAAKNSGMKLMMLVAKHHDGFCMWPSPYTDHDVDSSPFKRDIVGEITEACKRHGLRFGFYLSPADLYQIENEKGVYGKGSEYVESVIPTPVPGAPKGPRTFTYTVDDYNRYFLNQLYELLTQYGTVDEVWFDGANPKPGTGQEYNYADWYEMIHTLQPGANIAIAGPDVRWCGNEAGRTRRSEWSVVPATVKEDGTWNGPGATRDDLGSIGMLKTGDKLVWHPAETNTSIRHGWFWRNEEQHVKPAQEILDVWTRSVGGNSVFLLNLTPDNRGLIPDRDTAVLAEVGRILKATYSVNLATDASAETSSDAGAAFAAGNAIDGNPNTCWKTPDWSGHADLVLKLNGEQTFDRVLMQEQIKHFGQRISKFYVDAMIDGVWQEIGQGTTVGYKRILVTDRVTTDQVRIRIRGSRVSATLSNVSLHSAPIQLTLPKAHRSLEGLVELTCDPSGPQIRYTVDGTEPTASSQLYTEPFSMADGGTLKAMAVNAATGETGTVVTRRFGIAKALWKIHSVSSEQADVEPARFAIDDNPDTLWHSQWKGDFPKHPHFITIDLGKEYDLAGFTYLPRKTVNGGTIIGWQVHVSTDGENFIQAAEGEFGNIKNNPIEQIVRLSEKQKARYLKLVSLSAVNDEPWASAAEIGVLVN